MSIDPAMTVADILRHFPGARAVLQRFGLDACCGGAHPLEFACRAHTIDVQEVLAALEAVGASGVAIHPDMTVREVIEAYPATIPVFDRHGLIGCGGAKGPIEPLGWFAQVHEVDLEALLDELRRAALSGAAPVTEPITPRILARENLYRRFLKAALLFTFTGGAALGAWALILMALRGELGGIGRGLIQVHGHYQLFGWVGLFVVGVAYHILPRLSGRNLPSYGLASLSFVVLVAGTILRAAQALDPGGLRTSLLLLGALLEVAGCAIFAWTVARILLPWAARMEAYQGYLLIGTLWLVVASLLNLSHAWYLSSRAVFEVPPFLNVPYLTVFLVGFVTFFILGVSLRTLPVFMGLNARQSPAWLVAVPMTLSVMIIAIGESSYLAGGGSAARIVFAVGGLALAACLAVFAWALGIFRRAAFREPGLDRGYEKFLRLGYAWLMISGAMLAVFSVLALRGADMDHALVGAYRHALTVGFITTVMVGMASRIVPVFRGVPLYSTTMREWTFWLLALGNVMRVLFQVLSGLFGPVWLKVTGASGILELMALLLFGINLWKTMNTETPEDVAVASWKPAIASDTIVGDLLAAYPGLLPVFVVNGFGALANPVLRRTVARTVSIAQACRMHGVNLEAFLGQLSEAQARLQA
jgi:uncharacterized protein involved in response to NO